MSCTCGGRDQCSLVYSGALNGGFQRLRTFFRSPYSPAIRIIVCWDLFWSPGIYGSPPSGPKSVLGLYLRPKASIACILGAQRVAADEDDSLAQPSLL